MPRPSATRPRATALLFAAMTLAACADQPFTVDVPLRVVATDPSDAGAEIVREAVLRTTFSEPLTPETALDPANFTVTRLGVAEFEPESAVDGSLSHSEDGLTVTFTPSARLDYSSRYQLVVGRGARRLRDGAELPSEVRAVFRVTDPPPLRVIAVTPSGENEGVLRTAPLVITFSEGVRRAQLDPDGDGTLTADEGAHVAVVDAETGDAIEGTWNYNADDTDPENVDLIGPDTVATFTPTEQDFERWGYSQAVELRIKGTLESDRATTRGGQLGEASSART
jgi:VCBS repeat-containing protein